MSRETSSASRTGRIRALNAAIVLGVALISCQSGGPQIARLVVSPIVLPFPPGDENKLKASVKNFGEEPWEGGLLRVYGTYVPDKSQSAIFGPGAVPFGKLVPVPPLKPGEDIEVFAEEPIRTLDASIPASCIKLSCNGHLHLILMDPSGNQLAPPNTDVSITWGKSGETKDVTVVDEGIE